MRPIDADAFDRALAAGEFNAALAEADENDRPFKDVAMYYSTKSFRDVMKHRPTIELDDPIKPIRLHNGGFTRTKPVTFLYECFICGTGLMHHWIACPNCGTRIKWDE